MTSNIENGDTTLAAAESETIIKVGLEVHAVQITLCRQIDGCLPQPAQKTGWEKCVAWLQEQVQSGASLYSFYEAGPNGYGLHRTLSGLGVANYVVAPQRRPSWQ